MSHRPQQARTNSGQHRADEFITLADASQIIKLSEMTIRRRISDGTLPGFRVGPRGIRVKRSDVEALLRPVPAA